MSRYDEVWRRVRLQLVLAAEGKTASLGGNINSGKAEAKAPPPAGQELRDFDFRWICADSDGHRKRVIADALAHLKRMRTPNIMPEVFAMRGTRDYERMVASDPRPARTVASMYRISVRTVYNWREKHGKRTPVRAA